MMQTDTQVSLVSGCRGLLAGGAAQAHIAGLWWRLDIAGQSNTMVG